MLPSHRLRAFVKDQNLDVKTGGPGRKKKAILKDIRKVGLLTFSL